MDKHIGHTIDCDSIKCRGNCEAHKMNTKTDRAIAEVLAARLLELSDAVTKGKAGIDREFYMSIPAQPTRDVDLVMSASATHLIQILDERDELREALGKAIELANTPEHMQDGEWYEEFEKVREVLGE